MKTFNVCYKAIVATETKEDAIDKFREAIRNGSLELAYCIEEDEVIV